MQGVRTGVRVAITLFILILLSIVGLGLSWTSAHQAPGLRLGGQIVLALAGIAGIVALAQIWRADPPQQRRAGA
jgi:hypothetical protein